MNRKTTLVAGFVVCALCKVSLGAAVGPSSFQNPLVFSFTELSLGTKLGSQYANPYAGAGVQFTGFAAEYDYGNIHGSHLASGFANTPAEPYLVRIRLLDEPALRVGGWVWPEPGTRTSVTAFDDRGLAIESYNLLGDGGTRFMGIEASLDRPIRSLEWRALAGSSLSTFPRVDDVMVQFVPEPATAGFMLLASAGLILKRRNHAQSLESSIEAEAVRAEEAHPISQP